MTTDMHALSGAYAAGALPDGEREEFESHIATCSQCEQEVRELQETAALLGLAASAPPPPALRARVMAEIAETRQLPPLLSQQRTAPDAPIPLRRPESRLRRWTLTAAACLAVFTIGLGAYAAQVQRELSDLRKQAEQVTAVQTAADARSITASSRGAVATVTASRKANQLVFVSRGLSDPREGRTYQLWLIGKDGPQPAGTFEPASGRHEARILTNISDAVKLGITEEPDGGSAAPTTPVLMAIDIPEA